MFCGRRLAAAALSKKLAAVSCKQIKLAASAATKQEATTLFSLTIITTSTPSCLIIK